jgi:predicted porin
MKKSLIALAALAAVSAASAQSTVTISGGVTLGVGTSEIGTANSGTQVVRQTGNIQFAGSEDLGGGLKAGFQFQTTLGQAAATDLNNITVTDANGAAKQRTLLGDRAANLTLSGGFGTVLVGRGNTGIKNAMGVGMVAGLPVYTDLSASSSGASTTIDDGSYVNAGGDDAARIIYGDTWSNQVAYASPAMNGFTVSVGIAPVQTVATGVGNDGVTKDNISYSLAYANGPLAANVNFLDNQSGTAPYKATTVAANYDLGVVKIGVAQQSIRPATGVSPGNGTLITANVPVGAGAFGLGYGRRTASTNANFGDNVKQSYFGYKHNLSKRTHISAVYNQIDRNGTVNTDVKETHIFVGHSF